jgi:hypothetical protein
MQTSRFSQIIFTVIVVLAGLMILNHFMKGTVEKLKSSELRTYIIEDQVGELTLSQGSGEVRGKFLPDSSAAEAHGTVNFVASYPPENIDALVGLLDEHNVKYDAPARSC